MKLEGDDIPLPMTFNESTMGEVRAWLRGELAAGNSVGCPCCAQPTKVYARRLSKTMVNVLRALAASRAGLSAAQITKKANPTGSGDYAKMLAWGLVEQGPEHTWYCTAKGHCFLRGEISLPARVLLYNNRRIGFDYSETVHVDDLGGKFNLDEVLSAESVRAADLGAGASP